MLKNSVTVSDFIRRMQVIKSLSIVAFDNPGEPDEGKTGDGEFSEDKLPEELKDSFQKYKQTLIDKGVNIGVAREKEKAEKLKGTEVESFLKEQGISKEDIETLKPYLAKHKSSEKLYEAYGTDDIDEIIQTIEEADKELDEISKVKKELEKANSSNEDLKAQISALQKSISDKDLTISEKEQKLTNFVEKTAVNSAIKQAAIEAGAYDADDVLDRIKGQVKLEINGDDYIPYVVDDKGVRRYDSNGDPITCSHI